MNNPAVESCDRDFAAGAALDYSVPQHQAHSGFRVARRIPPVRHEEVTALQRAKANPGCSAIVGFMVEYVADQCAGRIEGTRRRNLDRTDRRPAPLAHGVSTAGAVLQDVLFRLAPLDDRGDMRAPCGERGALLVGPVMALVDADNAGPAARNVVENGLGHFEADAELLQAGGRRSPQIVERPIGDAAPLVEAILRFAPA